MARHYGIPYMGSKQKLVDKIIPFIMDRHPDVKHFMIGWPVVNIRYILLVIKLVIQDLRLSRLLKQEACLHLILAKTPIITKPSIGMVSGCR